MINNTNSIQFPLKRRLMLTLCPNCITTHWNFCKSFQTSTIRLNRKCSKVVGTSSDIFGNVWKSSENSGKSSQVAGTFSEIPVITRRKSHAFDSEKVGRYRSDWLGLSPQNPINIKVVPNSTRLHTLHASLFILTINSVHEHWKIQTVSCLEIYNTLISLIKTLKKP